MEPRPPESDPAVPKAIEPDFRKVAQRLWERSARARLRTRSGVEVVGHFYADHRPHGDFLQFRREGADGVFTVGWVGVVGLEEAPLPVVDRRLRTAPHGDGLVTTVKDIWGEGAWDFGSWTDLVSPALLATFKIHPHQQRFLDMIERGERPIMAKGRSSGWASVLRIAEERARRDGLFSKVSWDASAGGRLTPGALKLAGARIQAYGRDDRSVSQAMADQIDSLAPVLAERARTLVDEALEDEAIGLPALIMRRVSQEIHDSLPARIDQLVNAALTRIAVQQLEVEKAERERRRGPFRRRRN